MKKKITTVQTPTAVAVTTPRRQTKPARAAHFAPPEPLPPLTLTLTSPIEKCFVHIEGIGETASVISGQFPVGKRLAMAFAELTEKDGKYKGIAVNFAEAFELVSFDPSGPQVNARLKPGSTIVQLSALDSDYLERHPNRHGASAILATATAASLKRERKPSYWRGDLARAPL